MTMSMAEATSCIYAHQICNLKVQEVTAEVSMDIMKQENRKLKNQLQQMEKQVEIFKAQVLETNKNIFSFYT